MSSAPDECPSLQFIGTATTILRLGPFTLLTDPNFLHRGQLAYLGKGFVSRRRTEPALQPHELPPLDGVVLSHLHGDHFDRVARRELDQGLPVLTTPAAAQKLRAWGFGFARGLAPWATHTVRRDGWSLRTTAVPGTHAPGPARLLLPPVMGSVLELRDADEELVHRTYVTGDTLRRSWLRRVVERCGPLDAMVVHLGGTRLLGVTVTMDSRQGADLVEMLRPAVTVPVHHSDYGVFRSDLADFLEECRRRGLDAGLRPVEAGARVSLS